LPRITAATPEVPVDAQSAPGKSTIAGWGLPKRIGLLLALNGLIFSLALAALEAALRVHPPAWLRHRMSFLAAGANAEGIGTDRPWKVLRRDGRVLGFQPSSTFDVVHAEYQHKVNIDELGGRKLEPTSQSLHLLPCLGDSFTFGLGVDEGHTFLDYFQRQSRFRLLNFGVPGSALPSQRFMLETKHDELGRPRVYLLAFFLGNDFDDTLNDQARHDAPSTAAHTKLDPGIYDRVTVALNRYTTHSSLRHSYALQFLKHVAMRATSDRRRDPVFLMMDSRQEAYRERATRAVDAELQKWKELTERKGLTVVVLLVPDVHQISAETRERQAAYYGLRPAEVDPFLPNKTIRKLLRKHGLPFVDPTEQLAALPSGERLYYLNDHHFTVAGHRAFARVVGPEISSLLSTPD
jgi:SGNH hydrolase-like domain, acetyltransferase AlgX